MRFVDIPDGESYDSGVCFDSTENGGIEGIDVHKGRNDNLLQLRGRISS